MRAGLPARSFRNYFVGEDMEDRAIYSSSAAVQIRPETLKPATEWEVPTPDEVSELIRLTGLTHGGVSELLGLKPQANKSGAGSRTVRRWVAGDVVIPYAPWALLAYVAGFGAIWEKS